MCSLKIIGSTLMQVIMSRKGVLGFGDPNLL